MEGTIPKKLENLSRFLISEEASALSPAIRTFFTTYTSIAEDTLLTNRAATIESIGGSVGVKRRYVPFGPASLTYSVYNKDNIASGYQAVLSSLGLTELAKVAYLGDSAEKNLKFLEDLTKEMIKVSWDLSRGYKSSLKIPGKEAIQTPIISERLVGWGTFTLDKLRADASSRRIYWTIWRTVDSVLSENLTLGSPCYIGIQTYQISNFLQFTVFWRSVELINFSNDLYTFTALFSDFVKEANKIQPSIPAQFRATHFVGNFHFCE